MHRHLTLALGGLVLHCVTFAQTPTSTAILASPNPSNYGQPVTLTATVTSGATGRVTFYDGVTILGAGTLSGAQASLTTVMLPSGIRKLRAYYSGDGTYAGSSSAILPQTVVPGASLSLDGAVSYPGPWVFAIAVGDFNGDHKQDIVVANADSTVSVYLGNGDGTFQTGVSYPAGTYALAVGDFNGDGWMDLATDAGVLLGNGDGTFQPAISYPPFYAYYGGSIAVADFNGDGKADIVTSGVGPAVLLGNGDGTFAAPVYLEEITPVNSVVVADLNGDGKADIVAVMSAQLGVFLGNGDGTFQALPRITFLGESPFSITVADFNGDGVPDIAVSAEMGMGVMLGNGDGTFGDLLGYTRIFAPAAVADFNGDGKEDVVRVASPYPTDVAPGNGDGTFGNPGIYSVPASVAAVGDFNGDGKADLVLGGTGASAFSILLADAATPIVIQTTPPGLQFTIDGGAAQTAPQTPALWQEVHIIAVASPQPGPPGTQYVFTGWSDAGNASHMIAVGTTAATYTASFKTQYQLTTVPNPPPGGSVIPASGSYFDSGSTATLTATPTAPYVFTSWSGGAAGAANPVQVTMNAPTSVTANFNVPGFTCAITGDGTPSIADVQFIVKEALGLEPAVDDLNHDNVVNVADVQKLINAVLGLGCPY
jgi:hypothetical protein